MQAIDMQAIDRTNILYSVDEFQSIGYNNKHKKGRT